MKLDRTFSSVVFPAPVPPEMITLRRDSHGRFQKVEHRLGEGLAVDQVMCAEASRTKSTDRENRAVQRQRRDDGVHPRTVHEPGIDHRAGFVDPAPDRADDPLDDLQQVAVVLEHDRRRLQLAVPFDVDLIVTVHEDVRDVRVSEQRLQWTEPEELVQHVDDEILALREAQRNRLGLARNHPHDQIANLRLRLLTGNSREALQVQPVQQLLMNARLQFLIVARSGASV